MENFIFISQIAKIYKPVTYLELGLGQGRTFQQVIPHATKLIGVDKVKNAELQILEKYPKVNIYYTTTDEFFQSFNESVDMVYIDANPNIENIREDFNNSLRLLNPGGIILFHDTDPADDKYFEPNYCGDAYKIVSQIEEDPLLNIVTLPMQESGLSLVTRKNDTRTLRRHSSDIQKSLNYMR